MAAARWRQLWRCSRAPIARRGSWLASRTKGGARTSHCALRPLTAFLVSSCTDRREQYRLQRSRLMGDVIRALYVVRNPDKLRHLAAEVSRRTVADERPGDVQDPRIRMQ